MRWNEPPVVGVCLRVVASFLSYSVMSQYNLHPVSYCVLAFAIAASLHGVMGLISVQRVKRMPFKTLSMVSLYSLWCVVDLLAAVTALVKLHPFRMVVGEYVEYMSILVTMTPTAMEAASGVTYKKKTAIMALMIAFCVLGFAGNLAHYEPNESSAEDLINSIDTIGGMLLLLFFTVSDTFRKRYRARVVLDCDDESLHVDSVALLFGTLPLGILYVLNSLLSTSTSYPLGFGGLVWLVASASLTLAVPTFMASGKFMRSSTASLTPQLRVATTVACAFLLHISFHQHYKSGKAAEGLPHPIFHLDNLLVLLAGGLIGISLQLGGVHRFKDTHRGLSAASLDPVTLFDPMEGSPAEMSFITSMLSNKKQRRLSIFFSLTMTYMVIELVYGLRSNSLGLVSDSFHMLLDSASIAIGLYASYMALWKPNSSHAYGFGRYEVLSGFTNGVLLVFIAGYIFVEAIGRLINPPSVESEYLVAVSVCGLIVNLIGIIFFHEAHSHGHSHGGGECSHDLNMEGVYLHILGDFLGSVSVIISSLIVKFTGFMAADPICSAFVSLLILVSSTGLLKETGGVLLQRITSTQETTWETVTRQLSRVDGVKKLRNAHMWVQATSPSIVNVVTLVIVAAENADEKGIRQQALSLLRTNGFENLVAIEVEK